MLGGEATYFAHAEQRGCALSHLRLPCLQEVQAVEARAAGFAAGGIDPDAIFRRKAGRGSCGGNCKRLVGTV